MADEKQTGKSKHLELFFSGKKLDKRPRGHLDFGVAFTVIERKVGSEEKRPSTMSDIQPQCGKRTV